MVLELEGLDELSFCVWVIISHVLCIALHQVRSHSVSVVTQAHKRYVRDVNHDRLPRRRKSSLSTLMFPQPRLINCCCRHADSTNSNNSSCSL